jgi:DNA-directed RNA polymerase specialized sigma24 family protein
VLEEVSRDRGPTLLQDGYLLTGTHHAAQTLVEDALVAVFSRQIPPSTVDDAEAAMSRALRHAAVRRSHVSDAPADPDDPLAVLTPRERAVLAMRYVDGLAVPVIARECGLREDGVRDALTSAIARLDGSEMAWELSVEDALHGGSIAHEDTSVGDAR